MRIRTNDQGAIVLSLASDWLFNNHSVIPVSKTIPLHNKFQNSDERYSTGLFCCVFILFICFFCFYLGRVPLCSCTGYRTTRKNGTRNLQLRNSFGASMYLELLYEFMFTIVLCIFTTDTQTSGLHLCEYCKN